MISALIDSKTLEVTELEEKLTDLTSENLELKKLLEETQLPADSKEQEDAFLSVRYEKLRAIKSTSTFSESSLVLARDCSIGVFDPVDKLDPLDANMSELKSTL